MSRVYFNGLTNIEYNRDLEGAPELNYIALETKFGRRISLSCSDQADWGVGDGEIEGRWKGVEVSVEAFNGDLIHDYSEMELADFVQLEDARPYELGLYFPDGNKTNDLYVKDFKFEVQNGDSSFYFECEKPELILFEGE